MELTQVKGNLVELQCMMKFISMGFECSTPYGNQAKYDLLVDTGKEILRVQCKKSHWVDDKKSIEFHTCSLTTNTQKTTRHLYTSEQIDYFATCWEDKVYLVPVDECSTSKSLRMVPKEPKTPPNVNMAEDYLVENFLGHLSFYQESDYEEQVPIKIKENGNMLKGKCPDCGAPVWKEGSRCVSCANLQMRVVKDRPNREELKRLIRTETFVSISKLYNVSDNAIRKWCDSYNLPRKKSEIKKYSDEEWNKI